MPWPVAMATSACLACLRYVYVAGVPGTSHTAFPGEWGTMGEGLLALRFHPSEPEAHVHLVVHRPGGGEVLPGGVIPAAALLEPSQTGVAVGLEGAHAEFLRQGQRPEVVMLRVGGRTAACANVAEHAERFGLERPLAPHPRQFERPRRRACRLVEAVPDHERLGQLGLAEGFIGAKPEAFDARE